IVGIAAWQFTSRKPDTAPMTASAGPSMAAASTGQAAAAAPAGAAPSAAALAPRREGDDYVMGLASAPVTLIEDASLTCPPCAHFNEASFPEFKKAYVDTGLAKYVFRDFPLDRIALYGSMLARCGGEPVRFFAFIDVLFRQQASWIQGDETNMVNNLKRFAK